MDLEADEFRMAAAQRQAHAAAMTNEDNPRSMRDANSSTWSTDGQPGSSGRIVDYRMNIDWDEELARLYNARYKADHFTWTHVCNGECSRWRFTIQDEVATCGRCNDVAIYKYPTFNSSWRIVSKWWFNTPCHQWYYFCTVCK